DESYLPYMRPPLSKAFLQGEQTAEQLLIKPDTFYSDNDVEFIQAKVDSTTANNLSPLAMTEVQST
ncbi:MAG: hypothetical protein AAGM29_18365, partial [Cyanobacteria bacterium J06588_4]